jgi:hypothetical protein
MKRYLLFQWNKPHKYSHSTDQTTHEAANTGSESIPFRGGVSASVGLLLALTEMANQK